MDIFVFQMGKVASTSITHAINRQGLHAIQTHWLGRDQLVGSLDGTLLNVDINDERAFRGTEQFLDNIRYTRRLLWYRKHHRRDGNRLKVITLTREPISWYWGHVAENFDLYGQLILNWFEGPSGGTPLGKADPALVSEATIAFHESLFDTMSRMQTPLDDPGFEREAGRLIPELGPFLPRQLMKLRLPTAWFDTTFEPNIEIDVYRAPLDPQTGTARLDNDFAEVLLIRYEDLDSATGPLRAFLNRPELDLGRQNATRAKRLQVDIKAIASQVTPPQGMRERLRDTRYCRHFGYPTG